MMVLHLTEQQRQAVEAQQGRPIEVVDSATKRVYVLVAAEAYERVRDVLEEKSDMEPAGAAITFKIPPGVRRSQETFWRDLPELLRHKGNHGKWVAYHGDERLGISKAGTELYQDCLRRGLQRGDFYVGRIEERTVPPWGTSPLEDSLYEANDASPSTAVSSSV